MTTNTQETSLDDLAFWDHVYQAGLDPKVSGPVTEAHRKDFLDAMVQHVGAAIQRGPVHLLEDGAGQSPLAFQLGARLAETPDRSNLRCLVRDLCDRAVDRARHELARSDLELDVSIEQGDMFKRSKQSDGSIDFVVACMVFYCRRNRLRRALEEWARVAKHGCRGWFSLKSQDGDLNVVVRETVKGHLRSLPLWGKVFLPYAAASTVMFLAEKARSGAFGYGKALREGFESGKFYAPNEEQLRDDLSSAGLELSWVKPSLADQYFLVEWRKT